MTLAQIIVSFVAILVVAGVVGWVTGVRMFGNPRDDK
jgi:hypothetical protein